VTAAVGLSGVPAATRLWAENGPDHTPLLGLVASPDDAAVKLPPAQWAIQQLQEALASRGINLISLFIQLRHGSILDMGSVWAGLLLRSFCTHAYAAAKSAVLRFTRNCAAYYKGIRFNFLAPRLVQTPMAQQAVNDENIRDLIKTKQARLVEGLVWRQTWTPRRSTS
jgi:NAD(P)-dependent dehydrogenase (short-subunit alcohol dehydrogenase family)